MQTKERLTYWIMIASLIVLFLLQRQCGKPCPLVPVIYKIDTVVYKVKDTSPVYIPKPVTITRKRERSSNADMAFWISPEATPFRPDPYLDDPFASVPVASDSVLFNEITSVYSDTLRVPEPAQGYFVVQDTVNGYISSRRIIRNFSVPVAVHQHYRNTSRTELYIGGEVLASKQTLLNYGGISIGIKTKRDIFYEFRALGPLQGGPALFGFGVKTKISLRPF